MLGFLPSAGAALYALALYALVLPLALAADDSLLWGPYRPNVYFGMRPQIPESLLTGLMWYSDSELSGLGHIRHDCQNDDDVAKFGWTQYDPRFGGRQIVDDTEHGVRLTTDLVKSADGLAWEARIRGDQQEDSVLTLVFYAGLEAPADHARDGLALHPASRRLLTKQGIPGDVRLKGYSEPLGGAFELTITEGEGRRPEHWHEFASEKPAVNSAYTSLPIPPGHVWQARDVYLTLVQEQVNEFLKRYGDKEKDLPIWSIFAPNNDAGLGGNTHFVQKTFEGPFEFVVRYEPETSAGFAGEDDFDARLESIFDAQRARFDAAFSLNAPFDTPEYHAFAVEIVSNLAGGIGYFYGDSQIASDDDGVETAPPHELFTSTPSRTFFPRGFYWDEGFHLLGLMRYDEDLALQIFDSWFDVMDDDGWIAREQILGAEGRSRVPAEFQVQDPHVANPPTMVMALAHLSAAGKRTLESLYPRLTKHFEWFRRTQRGDTTAYDRELPAPREAFRWRGRTPTHILASGLDDYPRAPVPSDGELHVDLLAWVGAMARSLAQIAESVGEMADARRYRGILHDVQTNLLQVHWSKDAAAFCDITIDEYEEDSHVCHIGYVTHLPFMLRLVPEDSEGQLLAVMEQLRDPSQLWSVGGIRSLSKQDPLFGTDENYWRGPVWNNMNYLTLDALQHYASANSGTSAKVKARAAEIYAELRRNVGTNIYEQWLKSGYVWESYDATTGVGKGARQFTGWAALVANIMAMPERLGPRSQHDEL